MADDRNERRRWLDEPRHVTQLVYGVAAVLVATILADLLYHKHGHFAFEEWFAFHAIFGFAGYAFIVLAAKQLRKLLMRDETYYDD